MNSKDKTLKTFFWISSKNSASGLLSENFVACFFIRFVVFALALDVLFTLSEKKLWFYWYLYLLVCLQLWCWNLIQLGQWWFCSYANRQVSHLLLFLLDYRRIRIRIRTPYYWIRIQEAPKHSDPDADPDPDPTSIFYASLNPVYTIKLGQVKHWKTVSVLSHIIGPQ